MAFAKTLTLTGQGSTTANSAVWIVDGWADPQNIGVGLSLSGALTYSVQGSYDDFKPQWDLVANTATWYNTNFSSATTTTNGTITGGPFTMLRLNSSSGTGTVTAKFVQTYAGRAT
jgi:L-fucose isomerase-like protein